MFQFTNDELLLAPGMAAVLTPPHIASKLQQSTAAAHASAPAAETGIVSGETYAADGVLADDSCEVEVIEGTIGLISSSMEEGES